MEKSNNDRYLKKDTFAKQKTRKFNLRYNRSPMVYKQKLPTKETKNDSESFKSSAIAKTFDEYKEYIKDPEIERKLHASIRDFCKAQKKSKIQKKVKNMIVDLEGTVESYYEEIGELLPICPICRENNIFCPKVLKCKHELCYPCYVKMIKSRDGGNVCVKCPLCRKHFHSKLENDYHSDDPSDSDSD